MRVDTSGKSITLYNGRVAIPHTRQHTPYQSPYTPTHANQPARASRPPPLAYAKFQTLENGRRGLHTSRPPLTRHNRDARRRERGFNSMDTTEIIMYMLMPFISGLVGYGTNVIALKM